MTSGPTSAAAQVALSSSQAFASTERVGPGAANKVNKVSEDAEDAGAKFEQLLLFELLKTMRKTISYAEEGGDGFARGALDGMFDQAVAEASAGRLGVAPMLARQLDPTSAGTAPGAGRVSLPVSPAAMQQAFTPPPRGLSPVAPSPTHPKNPGLGTFGGAVPKPGDLPVDGRKSSDYGWRMHPISHERKFHGGIDLAAPEGTEVHAAQSGTVTFAGRRPGYGKTVEILHPDGSLGRYAHGSRIHVSVGDRVEVGEAIADVGSTGSATGPHLHFEVRRNGHPVDPTRYLEKLRDSQVARDDARRVGVLVGETG